MNNAELIEHHRNLAEAAGTRAANAVAALASFRECLNDPHDFDAAVAELKGAIADLYDTGVDLPHTLQGRYADHQPDAEPQLATLARETHALVVVIRDALIGAPEPVDPNRESVIPDAPVPPTEYGVRVLYADDTAEDFDNVNGIQVFRKSDGTFPFGFIEVAGPEGGNAEHRAGFWDLEGRFETFDSRDQPNPNRGW